MTLVNSQKKFKNKNRGENVSEGNEKGLFNNNIINIFLII